MAHGESWGWATTLKQAATINSLPPEWLPFVDRDAHWPAALRQSASAIELQLNSARACVPTTSAKHRDAGNQLGSASVDCYSQSSGLSDDEIAVAAHMARMVQADASSAPNHAHAPASQSGPFFHFLDCHAQTGSQPSVGAPQPPRLESVDSFKSLADLAARSAFSPNGAASPALSQCAAAAFALSRSSSELDGCDLSLSLGSPSSNGGAAEADMAWAAGDAEAWGAEMSMEQSGESGQGGCTRGGGQQADSACADGWLLLASVAGGQSHTR